MLFPILFFSCVIFLISAIGRKLLWLGLKGVKLNRLIANIPTSRIKSLAIGLSEIKGKSVPKGSLMKSPLTGQDCIGYYLYITVPASLKALVVGVKATNIIENKLIPFFVKDETGKLLVDPSTVDPIDTNKLGMQIPMEMKTCKDIIPLGIRDILKKK